MSKESPNEFKIINKNERLEYRQFIDELEQELEEQEKLLKCYQDEEKLIADILGDKDLTIIGSRVHLKNLIVELKNKIKDRDIVIEEKDKEIEKLKQELAESEKKVDEFHDKLLEEMQNRIDREVKLTNCLNNVVDERDQLKYQLDESFTEKDVEGLIEDREKTIKFLQQQLAEKDKEIERLKKNHLISYTNQKKAYENLKNSMNTQSLIKYPKRLDGCLIKNEQQLLDYAKESTLDIKYLRNNQTQLAIQELEKAKAKVRDVSGVLALCEVEVQIDQQIKELKGE